MSNEITKAQEGPEFIFEYLTLKVSISENEEKETLIRGMGNDWLQTRVIQSILKHDDCGTFHVVRMENTLDESQGILRNLRNIVLVYHNTSARNVLFSLDSWFIKNK